MSDDNVKEGRRCWSELISILSPPNTLTPRKQRQCSHLIESLRKHGFPISNCLGTWYCTKVKIYFQTKILPEVSNIMSGPEPTFDNAINFLTESVIPHLQTFQLIKEIDETFSEENVYLEFNTILLNVYQHTFSKSCEALYKSGFTTFDKLNQEGINDEDKTVLNLALEHFDRLNRMICCLHLFDNIALDPVLHVLNSEIKKYIESNFAGLLETSIISGVLTWVDQCVIPYIQFITKHFAVTPNMEMWKNRLNFFCYQTILELRVADLFEIMVDYPLSHDAVSDIKTCLSEIQLKEYLITSVRQTFEERLLHPGANTEDIITQYTSAIKVLTFLDPSRVILERVCGPLRLYLKNRSDTIRCILTNLVGEEESELSRELAQNIGKQRKLFNVNEDSDLECDDWEKWVPQSKDMPLTSTSSRSADTISTLCNIYGSGDVFINEYRNILADKLLTSSGYDVSKEMRNLELLKIGFGQDDLNLCSIMLQDIADSKRIHSHIMNKLKNPLPFEFNALILSHVFWPNLRNEDINVVSPLKNLLEDDYIKLFATLKRSRTLEWKYNLGFVDLELEFEDKVFSFTVSPVQATVISMFEDKDKLSADTISREVGLSLSQTRKKLAFWVTNGILRESSKDIFEVRADVNNNCSYTIVEVMDSAMVKIEEVREEELEGFTNFIMGLLNASGQITVERVHSLLSMLLADSVAGQLTIEQIRTYLDKKVKQKLLVFTGGVFKKNPN